jgi:acetamidase/formamidase
MKESTIMARHVFQPRLFHNAIGLGDPVHWLEDGDTVVTQTIDAWGFDSKDEQVATRPNPVTGPFFVRGAEPGDTLEVRIGRMTPSRATGWTFAPIASNVVDPGIASGLPERRRSIWTLECEGTVARLADASSALKDWTVPIRPMIGCFGVAPPLKQAISTTTSGPYGGNMDYPLFAPGTRAQFPVFAPGALFYLGDGHASQGDGEIVGNGIETSFEVEFAVRVLKGRGIGWPRGETLDEIFTVGNARPLDQALQHATSEMLRWLSTDFGLDPVEASHVLGQCVRFDVANVFNPAYSVACRLSRKAIPSCKPS